MHVYKNVQVKRKNGKTVSLKKNQKKIHTASKKQASSSTFLTLVESDNEISRDNSHRFINSELNTILNTLRCINIISANFTFNIVYTNILYTFVSIFILYVYVYFFPL